jgi:hypothetical protein
VTELLDAATCYAARGWAVFPVHGIFRRRCTCGRSDCGSPGKHPLVRHGLYEATTDEGTIRGWWRQWRRANVGIATGSPSGIVVVDVDIPEGTDSLDLLEREAEGLPDTLSARTGSGGKHLVFHRPARRLGNSAGRLHGFPKDLPGVDLRGEGGYIVAPPSLHASGGSYEWVAPRADLAPLPEWIREPPRCSSTDFVSRPASFGGDGSAYGLAVLCSELVALSTTPPGGRNHSLNRRAFALARLVAGGELLEGPVRDQLLQQGLAIGLTEWESRMTIDSAFSAGLNHPRAAPHRMSADAQ